MPGQASGVEGIRTSDPLTARLGQFVDERLRASVTREGPWACGASRPAERGPLLSVVAVNGPTTRYVLTAKGNRLCAALKDGLLISLGRSRADIAKRQVGELHKANSACWSQITTT